MKLVLPVRSAHDECPITVLMAVYNGGEYLVDSIDSILGQTFNNFRFLIIDDGSTDYTHMICDSYHDDRIEYFRLDHNVGQTAALNLGFRKASTPWIARMDADDFSAPDRLEKQMERLTTESSLSCLGTFAWYFTESPEKVDGKILLPLDHREIKEFLLHDSPVVEGSIMVSRKAVLDVGGYDEKYKCSADIDLYDRLFEKYVSANLPESLLGIRRHIGQISRSFLAVEENIMIAENRLSYGRTYTVRELQTARAALARCLITRGFYLGKTGRLAPFLRDCVRAYKNSSGTFFSQITMEFLRLLLPIRFRISLKRYLSRYLSFWNIIFLKLNI